MQEDQGLNPLNEFRTLLYYAQALAIDDFDIRITAVDEDPSGKNAKAELLLFQDKGRRREVVVAARLRLSELEALGALIGKKIAEFKEPSGL
jgi:hypothetical protein